MKLVETPVKSNLDLESAYPNITRHIFGKKSIRYFKLYSLDRTRIIYADLFDKVNLVLINSKKKITKSEIDFAIKRLLDGTREDVTIHLDVKNEMEKAGVPPLKTVKDVIVIQKKVEE